MANTKKLWRGATLIVTIEPYGNAVYVILVIVCLYMVLAGVLAGFRSFLARDVHVAGSRNSFWHKIISPFDPRRNS